MISIKMSDEEQRELYNTCSKESLISMVIECNKTIERLVGSSSESIEDWAERLADDLSKFSD